MWAYLNKLIELGLKKKAGQITMSWSEIGATANISGEDARQAVKRYLKRNGKLPGKYESGRERILIFSDTHIPDHNEELILDIVKQNKTVNTIIINGDILDCKAVSSFYDEEITILDHEMIIAHDLLSKIRNITKAKILLVKGNHEERVNRHYAQNAKSMGSAVVETEILYKLATGFEIKRRKNNKIIREKYPQIENVEYVGSRSYLHGDLLVNHPSTFRKDFMKTVSIMYKERFKSKYPQAKVIVIGHTHQAGMIHIEDGVTLIECGCTCNPMSYAEKDDRPYSFQQRAYVYLEMYNGKVDQQTIHLHYLGHDELEHYDEIDDEI